MLAVVLMLAFKGALTIQSLGILSNLVRRCLKGASVMFVPGTMMSASTSVIATANVTAKIVLATLVHPSRPNYWRMHIAIPSSNGCLVMISTVGPVVRRPGICVVMLTFVATAPAQPTIIPIMVKPAGKLRDDILLSKIKIGAMLFFFFFWMRPSLSRLILLFLIVFHQYCLSSGVSQFFPLK